MSPRRAHRWWLRLLLVPLVLAGFFARGVVSPAIAPGAPDSAQIRIIQALGGTICHTDLGEPDAPSTPPSGPGHAPDCAVCPYCASLAAQSVILPPGTAVPPRRLAVLARHVIGPSPRAPPLFAHRTAQPRAPPTLA